MIFSEWLFLIADQYFSYRIVSWDKLKDYVSNFSCAVIDISSLVNLLLPKDKQKVVLWIRKKYREIQQRWDWVFRDIKNIFSSYWTFEMNLIAKDQKPMSWVLRIKEKDLSKIKEIQKLVWDYWFSAIRKWWDDEVSLIIAEKTFKRN